MEQTVGSEDASNCLSGEELAELLEQVFATWQGGRRDGRRRRTPRMDVQSGKSLNVVAYRFEGRDFGVARPAKLADLSADGLGIEFDLEIPVGAQMCFSFRNDQGEQSFGWARVTNTRPVGDGFKIGLEFDGDAQSLDPEASEEKDVRFGLVQQRLAAWLDRGKLGFRAAWAVVVRRRDARRELIREADGVTARFIVDVKLTRYNASLFVGGRRVSKQSGVLLDRLYNLWSDAALPTMIHLEADGFSAWATMRPHQVTRCRLDLSVAGLQDRCQRLVFGTHDDDQSDEQGVEQAANASTAETKLEEAGTRR